MISNRPFSERKQVVANVRDQVVAGESVSAADVAVLLDEHDLHLSLVDRLADRYIPALSALRGLVDRHDEARRGRDDGFGWQQVWDQAIAVVSAEDRDPVGVVKRLRAIEKAAEAYVDYLETRDCVDAAVEDDLIATLATSVKGDASND